ncbi:MAG: hypothetical protein IKN63_05175, partial [Bacilli bacterium]|nr:hypothetical protein [Bacilli bacterium]
MKTIKLENRITFFILIMALFLLNFQYISFLSIIFGSLISFLIIKLLETLNIYKYKITKAFLLITSIFSLTYYLNKISYFIGDNILREYSIIPITFTLLLSVFLLGNKFHTIIKLITISSYFILLNLIIGIIILIPYIDISNLNMSILFTNNLIFNTIIYVTSLVYTYFLIFKISNTKLLKRDLIMTNSFNLLYFLLVNSILSILTNILKYPYLIIFKKVNLIWFIERIEIIFAINYLFIFY